MLPPSPNIRWKTTRGSRSCGSGVVDVSQEVEFTYAQLYPFSQLPTRKFVSVVNSSDRRDVSAPSLSAAYWSIVLPASRSAPSVRFGRTPLSQPPCARVCTPPPSFGLTTPRLLSPLRTTNWSRNGSSGVKVGDNSKFFPPGPFGWKLGRNIPFGT